MKNLFVFMKNFIIGILFLALLFFAYTIISQKIKSNAEEKDISEKYSLISDALSNRVFTKVQDNRWNSILNRWDSDEQQRVNLSYSIKSDRIYQTNNQGGGEVFYSILPKSPIKEERSGYSILIWDCEDYLLNNCQFEVENHPDFTIVRIKFSDHMIVFTTT